MAIPMIETGYKPEYALGALYQGFNAGNADMAAREDILKQYLANAKTAQEMPLDLDILGLQAARARRQTNPEDLDWFSRGYTGQMKSQDAAGNLAQVLLPFKQTADQRKLEEEAGQSGLMSDMYKAVQGQYDSNLPENERVAAAQRGLAIADTMSKINPKFMSQERMLDEKLKSADLLNLRNNETRMALAQLVAQTKQRAVAGDKTAQQALISMWQKQVANGEITQAEYGLLVADLQTSINAAKVQPGITPIVTPTGEVNIGNKPTQQPVRAAPERTQQPTTPRKPLGEY